MEFKVDQYTQRLNQAIDALDLEGNPPELYDPIRYIMSLGGKRIRPILCLLAADLFEGNESQATLAALSIEVFHNFTLVHDDIMDEAPLRRGKKTVHEKWNRDIAILSGDVMFVKAYDLLLATNSPKLPVLIKLFNTTAVEVCEGQQLDMNFETTETVSIENYIRMIELKTSVLLACSLKMGALISDANEVDANHLYDFGKNLGIAFQIQDDLLDAYGDPTKFGKRVGGDIISNKKTYLLLTALEAASVSQKSKLLHLFKETNQELKISETKSLFEELGVPDKTERAIAQYYESALQSLEKISIAKEKKTPLRDLAKQIMDRTH